MICRALGQSMILMPGRAPKAAVSKLEDHRKNCRSR